MRIPLLDSSDLFLNPIQLEDQANLHQLMDEIYRAGYRDYWIDNGDWYVNLIYNPETLEKELGRIRSHYFFVELKGENVGILKYDFPFSPKELEIPNAMKLHRLYLHPKTHGKGIAQVLMNHCEGVARKNRLNSIWLEAMDAKSQAMRFYEKSGFEVVFTYILGFENLKPDFRKIHILKKSLG